MTTTGRGRRVGTAMAVGLLLAALARVAPAAESRLEIDPAHRLTDLARSAEPVLTIDRRDGVYLVDASAVLDADPARLLAASLAYDRYARMGMPNVRDSRVVAVEADGTRWFVWASMTGLGQTSKHYLAVHVREHLEPAGAAGVRWELAPTRPSWPYAEACAFTRLEGSWYQAPLPGGGVYVRYFLAARPAPGLPDALTGWLVRRLLGDGARQVIHVLAREARGGGPTDG